MNDDTTPATPGEQHDPAAVPAPDPDAPAAASVPSAPKKKLTRYLTPALAVVAALVVGGVGGVFIGQSTAHAAPQRAGFGQGAGGFRGGEGFGGGQGGAGGGQGAPAGRPGAGGAFTAGTITAVEGSTITLKLQDGSTVKVGTSAATKVTRTSTSSVSKLKSGDTVTVVGQKDASGDVTATTIAEGQAGFGGFRGGFGGGTGGSGGSGSGD